MLVPLAIAAAAWLGWELFGPKKSSPAPAFVPQLPGTPPVIVQPPATAPEPTPPTLTDLAQARILADQVDADVRSKGAKYDQQLVNEFQRLTRLWRDGLYGPKTAGAVQFFTGRAPPTPIYSSKSGSRAIVPYTPPS